MKKSTKFNAFLLGAMVLASSSVIAQVKIGDNPTTINPSAVLDVESTNKGILPPRLTSGQRNAIGNPASGLVIFNTTENCLQINVGTPSVPVWECSNVKQGGDNLLRFNDKKAYIYIGAPFYNFTAVNSEIPVPTASYNFTTTVSGTLSLTFSAFVDWSSPVAGTFQHVEYRLYIDNTLVGSQTFEHNLLEAASVSITGYKSITQGAHNVQLRAYLLTYSSNVAGSLTPPYSVYQSSYYANIQ